MKTYISSIDLLASRKQYNCVRILCASLINRITATREVGSKEDDIRLSIQQVECF